MRPNRADELIHKIAELYTTEAFVIAVTVLAVLARCVPWSFASRDMTKYLLPWFDQVRETGIRVQVGNYNLLYQTIIFLMSKLPIPAIMQYKILSCAFDFFLAWNVAFLLRFFNRSKSTAALGYAVTLFLPTVILNSAVWGQCDSIFTAFVLLFLNLLLRKRWSWAFFSLGIAFSFKLQAVFILPLVFYLYFSRKEYSVFSAFYTFLGFYLPCLPAVLLRGDPVAPFRIYSAQVGEYKRMYLNYPSFWTLVGADYDTLSRLALLTAIVVLGAGLLLVLNSRRRLEDYAILRLGVFSVWSCLLFLPAMHERYGFLLELLLLVLSFLDLRAVAAFIPMELTSCLTYRLYLFGEKNNLLLLSCVSIFLYVLFSVQVFSELSAPEKSKSGAVLHLRGQRHAEEKET